MRHTSRNQRQKPRKILIGTLALSGFFAVGGVFAADAIRTGGMAVAPSTHKPVGLAVSEPDKQSALPSPSVKPTFQAFGGAATNAQLASAVTAVSDVQSEPETSGHGAYSIDPSVKKPQISAISYLIGDVQTGEIITDRYKEYMMPIASVSKLMTALVSLNTLPQYDTVRLTQDMINTYGTFGELKTGQVMSRSELLYPLLLESSNDAAEAIAQSTKREDFIKNMNDTAATIGMSHTFYEDPSGLSPNNVSTTEDLFTLARYITQHEPIIFDITREPTHSSGKQGWHNISKFLRFVSYRGGKNGYTDEAGKTIVTLFSLPITRADDSSTASTTTPRTVAIILLDSKDNQKDVVALMNYVLHAVHYKE